MAARLFPVLYSLFPLPSSLFRALFLLAQLPSSSTRRVPNQNRFPKFLIREKMTIELRGESRGNGWTPFVPKRDKAAYLLPNIFISFIDLRSLSRFGLRTLPFSHPGNSPNLRPIPGLRDGIGVQPGTRPGTNPVQRGKRRSRKGGNGGAAEPRTIPLCNLLRHFSGPAAETRANSAL